MTIRRHPRRRPGTVSLSLVLGLGLLLWLFPVPLPRGRVVDPLAARLAEQFGAEVRLEGAGLRLLPRPSLRLGPGSVVRAAVPAAVPATGTASPQAAVPGIDGRWARGELTLALLPLAQGKMVAAGGKVSGADLVLEGSAGGPTWRIAGAEIELRGLHLDLRALAVRLQSGLPADLPAVFSAVSGGTDATGGFDLSAQSLEFGQGTYQNVMARGEFKSRILEVEDFAVGCGGGRVQGTATLDHTVEPKGRLAVQAALAAVPAEAILRPWAADLGDQLDLTLDGKIHAELNLGQEDVAVRTLTATGTLGGATGTVHARPWLTDVAPYLGQRQDLQDIRTEAWTLDFQLTERRCQVDLDLRGPDTNWQGQGWIGLEGAMDVGLRVALPPGYTPELGQWAVLAEMLRDKQRRVNLSFRLSGPFEDLQFGLDLAGMLSGGGR